MFCDYIIAPLTNIYATVHERNACYHGSMIGLALTKEQMATLLKMVFIANTIANDNADGEAIDRADFEDLEQYVFSRAKEVFPMAVYQHKAGEEEHHHPSVIFENDPDISGILDEYDTHAAVSVISEKLAERDIATEFGKNAKDQMSMENYVSLLEDKATHYEDLFVTHGFDILELNGKYK